MLHAGGSRRRIARRLSAAYAGGLLSEQTFVWRLDQLLGSRLIDPLPLIGDLNFRRGTRSKAAWLRGLVNQWISRRFGHAEEPSLTLLALDWSGLSNELLIGRHHACDVVLADPTVSRHHARLVFRDAKWIVHDLASTNGTSINGTYVGRCELRPGDRLRLGDEFLAID